MAKVILLSFHCVEKWKISLTKKILSNQFFSNLFSEAVTFTKFLPTWERIPFHNVHFHTVENTEFYCHDFLAKIPSNQRFTKELYYELIWRKKNLCGGEFLVFPHSDSWIKGEYFRQIII